MSINLPAVSVEKAPSVVGQESVIVSLFRRYYFLFALILATIFLAINLIMQPNFGLSQQLAAFAPLAIAAMASVPSVVSGPGGLDMSISPIMTFSAIVYALWIAPTGIGAAAFPVMIIIGGMIGAINGLLIVLLRLPPIVVTLSMFFVLTGINLRLAPLPVPVEEEWLSRLVSDFGFLPGALITFLVPILLWLIITRTAYGRALYAVGGNDTTAFSAGVNVQAIRIFAYGLGGSFAAVGGLALTGLVGSASGSTSTSYTLIAIAAVALGGISLAGGRGGVVGALVGAAAIFLLQSALGVLQVSQIWLQVVYGILLLFAVVFGAVLASPDRGKS